MKNPFGTVIVMSLLVLTACEPTPAPVSETPVAKIDPTVPKWTAKEGIDTPESAYMDMASGFIYVSNIVGMPAKKDGNGRISRLLTNGKVIEPDWVTGLNAPKGLRSFDGILWTADIDEVIGIEIATGKIKSRVKIAGAKFLNDVACGPDGTVYVSDMLTSKIHAVKNGMATVFASGDDIEYPNGLLVEDDHLVVGGWGKPDPKDFSTKVPGRLFMLDLKTQKKTAITADPFANIDGLESDGKGGYIVSDWAAGKIMQVSAKGAVRLIATFPMGRSDPPIPTIRASVLNP